MEQRKKGYRKRREPPASAEKERTATGMQTTMKTYTSSEVSDWQIQIRGNTQNSGKRSERADIIQPQSTIAAIAVQVLSADSVQHTVFAATDAAKRIILRGDVPGRQKH